jgi:hypothetical protein
MRRDVVMAWVLLGGCAPQVGTEGGGTDDDSGSTTATTAGTATTPSDTTASTTMTTSADTTATTSTTTTTTGEPTCASDWVSGCQSYCAALITCHPDLGSYEECVMDCVNEIADLGAECQFAWCEAYSCFGGLDCATLDNGSPECDELGYVAESLCFGNDDVTTGGKDSCGIGGNGSDECEYSCLGTGRRFVCVADLCTCYENDNAVAGCESNGVCDDLGNLPDYSMDCCGW